MPEGDGPAAGSAPSAGGSISLPHYICASGLSGPITVGWVPGCQRGCPPLAPPQSVSVDMGGPAGWSGARPADAVSPALHEGVGGGEAVLTFISILQVLSGTKVFDFPWDSGNTVR